MTTPHQPAYRPDIDGLRALAILPVVAFHAFPEWISGGFVGVDVFFVISGYLISSIIFQHLKSNSFSFITFYARRIQRIFPALVLVLIACYAVGRFVLLPEELKQLSLHVASGAGFIQNFMLWRESGYFDEASELKPLMHLWSLAIEEQFYLLYPVLIWLGWRRHWNVLVIIAMVGLLSFALNLYGMQHDAVGAFFSPQTRFWELMVGAALAYHSVLIHTEQENSRMNNVFASLGLLLICAAVFTFNRQQAYPGWRAAIPVLGAGLLLLAGPRAWINRKWLGCRIMVAIGLISYPLYLWHWPLLSFARIMDGDAPSLSMRLAIVGISFILAGLTYWLLEGPMRRHQPNRYKTIALCVALGLIGFVGHANSQTPGSDDRVLQQQIAMFDGRTMPWYVDDFCKQRYSTIQKFCRLGKDAPPTVLLMGDSHATVLFTGVKEALDKTKDNVLMMASGIPLYNIDRYDSRDKPGESKIQMDKAFALAERTASIHTVILASMGTVYFTNTTFNGYGATRVQGQVVQLVNRPDVTDSWKMLDIAMRDTFKRLLASGKQVIFVLDVPELGFRPQSCVDMRPVKLTEQAVRTPCAVPRKDFEARDGAYRQFVLNVLKDYPKVKVFDAAASLCDQEWCWAIKNDRMLYFDYDHVSLDGSRLVGKELVSLLRKSR
jgi:peptidoglycan/LPS O-acetylase OafA/YrhL